jgi:hypothetical protein
MAFSADELRVLRRALAEALQPSTHIPEDVQVYLRLAEALDEAVREGGRLRTFQSAELVRYRAALPGAAAGYLERLRCALESGYTPDPEDLAALRRLCRLPRGAAEERRRTALLRHCEYLAELDVRARLERRIPAPGAGVRPRLLALPGGRDAKDQPSRPEQKPKPTPDQKPEQKPKPDQKPEPDQKPKPEQKPEPGRGPSRKVPTPGEIWPPRRRPSPPPEEQRRGA